MLKTFLVEDEVILENEDELNDFIFDKLSWSNFKNFLFKNASFGKNKDEE